MSEAPPGNAHYTDTHTHALDLLRHALGAKVITTYEHGRAHGGGHLRVSQAGQTTGYYYTRGRKQRAAFPEP